MVSIILPIHDMQNGAYFLWRAVQSIMAQTYTDYEIIITQNGKMAQNTNAGIKRAKGEIIKILYMDDYFAHPQALQRIVDAFTGGWLATACNHTRDGGTTFNTHQAVFSEHMAQGNNTIGSPSVVAFENKDPLLFDEHLSWLLDGELYDRLYERYGMPTIIPDVAVTIGIGEHQISEIMTDHQKMQEVDYVANKLYEQH